MPSRISSRLARIVALLFLAIASLTSAAQSQEMGPRSNTTGLLVGLFLNGSSIDSDDLDGSNTGGGISGQLGWGFTPMFTILVGASGAQMSDDPEDFALVHLDFLGRFNFRSGEHAFVPFLEVGMSARAAGQDDAVIGVNGSSQTGDLEMAGGAFTFGGGFHYFVAPTVALGANLQISTGKFSTVEFDDVEVEGLELDATSSRLNVGLTWYPVR